MAFEPIEWKENESPALDAENLNRIEAGIDNALPKSGGTMTGSLILKGEPTEDNEAANKSYVDNNIRYYYYSSIDLSKISHGEEKLLFSISDFDSSKYLPNITLRPHADGGTFYGSAHFWYPISYNVYRAFDDKWDGYASVKITTAGDVYIKKTTTTSEDYYDDKVDLEIILLPVKTITIN